MTTSKRTITIWGILFILLGGALWFLRPLAFMTPAPELNTAPRAGKDTDPANTPGHADLRIYGTAWGLTLATDGSGIYNEILRLALVGSRVPATYDVRPYRRAKALFSRDQNSCLYPSNIPLLMNGGEIDGPDGYLDSAGLLHVKVFVFAPHGSRPPSGIRDIDGQSVAYAMGSRIPHFLRDAQGADFIAVADETDKARMLLTGRVNLITAALPDAKFVYDQLGTDLPPFDPAYELNDTLVRVTCHDSAAARAFLAAFNASIKNLKANGVLETLLSGQGLDPKLYAPGTPVQ